MTTSVPGAPARARLSTATHKEQLIVHMARALHRYGAPAHRLEAVMELMALNLGMHGQFYITPTAIIACFGEGPAPNTILLRVEPGEVNLAKQVALDAALADVLGRRCTLEEGLARVADIEASAPRYGPVVRTLAFMLASAAASVFFGGGWWDMAVSAFIGTCIGLLAWVASRAAPVGRLFEALGALLATLIATGSASVFGDTAVQSVVLAGVISLVPGLMFTTALTEIATRNLVAGTARFMGALVVLLQLGFGVAVGRAIGSWFPDAYSLETPIRVPGWIEPIAVVVSSIAFTVLLRARMRDALWVLGAGALAYVTARLGSQELGPTLGAFGASFLVSVTSNLRARILRSPTSVTLVPGIIMLVPGSVGFRSMSAFLEHDVVSALDIGFSMFMVGVSIVAGILFANIAVPPRRAL